MLEQGIAPPPREPLARDVRTQSIWERWFKRLVDAVPRVRTYTVTFDPASVSANTTSEQTVTVTGLGATDIVYVNKPTHTPGLGIVGARVSAADTLAITLGNFTALAIDASSENYYVVAIRR